jgi:predicted transglutaminase-like protease
MFKRQKPVESRASQLSESKEEVCRKQIDTTICKQLKDGSDYKSEIEHALDIIEMTHSSESNMLNRYMLVENSSKLLKKELDDRKLQVEANIRAKMKLLVDARTQYHHLFEERNRLQQEERSSKD